MKSTATLAPADLAAVVQSGATNHTKRNIILVIVILVTAIGGWLWWRSVEKAKNRAPAYVTEPLTRGNISLVITATGNLYPTNEVVVGSELSGITLEVYVDFNDHVTKGQPLAKLDTSKLTEQTESSRAAVKAAQAKVVVAEATVTESQALLTRQQDLQKRSGGALPSEAALDITIATAARARADLLSANASVGEAEAQVHINEYDLSKAIIKSPIDGVVLTRSIEPGQTVAASFTAPELFIIAEKLERMKLRLPSRKPTSGAWPKVRAPPSRSMPIRTAPTPRRFRKVTYGSEVVNNVVTYDTELEVPNDDGSLRPGLTATVDIDVGEWQRTSCSSPPPPCASIPPSPPLRPPPQRSPSCKVSFPCPPATAVVPKRPAMTKKSASKRSPQSGCCATESPNRSPCKTGITDG